MRFIAYYLPQYHPIPENDEWWGKGFTEWTNVAKAKPLYPGHYQPHIPADLGFYDLRVPETRIAQAEMAREYGIEGFCYWHYWFAGRRLLERPFNEVLRSGEPNFPFCLAWANQSWTGIWHGNPNKILAEQTYPGKADDIAHFYAVLDAFCDSRYITIDGKPVFLLFMAEVLPEPKRFTDLWRELAVKVGLKGVYFIGISWSPWWNPHEHGFDAAVLSSTQTVFTWFRSIQKSRMRRIFGNGLHKSPAQIARDILYRPAVVSYANAIQCRISPIAERYLYYPTVMPNWDNTPRSGNNGIVLHNSTPELFKRHVLQEIQTVAAREPEQQVVFVKSWNEWAEGNYLEPDQRYGRQYLEALKEAIEASSRQSG